MHSRRARAVGLLIWLACILLSTIGHAAPAAKAGTLDLVDWSFQDGGTVELAGQWSIFWRQFIAPDAVLAGEGVRQEIAVPGSWTSSTEAGEPRPAEGFATFHLTLNLPADRPILALKVPPIRTAARVWINGTLEIEGGVVARDVESASPAYAPQIVLIPAEPDRVDIVIQVSNFHHRSAGLAKALELGTYQQITAEHRRTSNGDWLLLGAILLIAVYHLGLFAARRADPSALYFAIYCLAVCVRVPLTGQYLFYESFPEVDLGITLRIEYAAFGVAGPVFCMFLASLYPREWHRWAIRASQIAGGILVIVVFLAPLSVGSLMVIPMQLASVLGVLYIIWSLTRAIIKGREGAALFAAGFAVQAVTVVSDTLYHNGIIETGPLAAYGTFVFIVAQSLVLSRRFAKAFSVAEIYAATFRKFVPVQFLKRIAKEGVESIRLGNVESDDITILFSDIRSFTTISESLTPNALFAMLNGYLSRMEPPIQRHGGFVDKFIGDAIMALFDLETRQASARGAVQAALGMLAVLDRFNAERAALGSPPVLTGIGIHSGEVMIGTVGSNQRMDSTAIGDAVNLAARIEGMTKQYGARLLVSEHTLQAMDGHDDFVVRFADRVRVKGKQQPVGVWEVLGTVDDPALAVMRAALTHYEAGLACYMDRAFEDAAAHFEVFLEAVPGDELTRSHLDRCAQFTRQGVADDWDGTVSLTSK